MSLKSGPISRYAAERERERVDAEVDVPTAQRTTRIEISESPEVIYFFLRDKSLISSVGEGKII